MPRAAPKVIQWDIPPELLRSDGYEFDRCIALACDMFIEKNARVEVSGSSVTVFLKHLRLVFESPSSGELRRQMILKVLLVLSQSDAAFLRRAVIETDILSSSITHLFTSNVHSRDGFEYLDAVLSFVDLVARTPTVLSAYLLMFPDMSTSPSGRRGASAQASAGILTSLFKITVRCGQLLSRTVYGRAAISKLLRTLATFVQSTLTTGGPRGCLLSVLNGGASRSDVLRIVCKEYPDDTERTCVVELVKCFMYVGGDEPKSVEPEAIRVVSEEAVRMFRQLVKESVNSEHNNPPRSILFARLACGLLAAGFRVVRWVDAETMVSLLCVSARHSSEEFLLSLRAARMATSNGAVIVPVSQRSVEAMTRICTVYVAKSPLMLKRMISTCELLMDAMPPAPGGAAHNTVFLDLASRAFEYTSSTIHCLNLMALAVAKGVLSEIHLLEALSKIDQTSLLDERFALRNMKIMAFVNALDFASCRRIAAALLPLVYHGLIRHIGADRASLSQSFSEDDGFVEPADVADFARTVLESQAPIASHEIPWSDAQIVFSNNEVLNTSQTAYMASLMVSLMVPPQDDVPIAKVLLEVFVYTIGNTQDPTIAEAALRWFRSASVFLFSKGKKEKSGDSVRSPDSPGLFDSSGSESDLGSDSGMEASPENRALEQPFKPESILDTEFVHRFFHAVAIHMRRPKAHVEQILKAFSLLFLEAKFGLTTWSDIEDREYLSTRILDSHVGRSALGAPALVSIPSSVEEYCRIVAKLQQMSTVPTAESDMVYALGDRLVLAAKQLHGADLVTLMAAALSDRIVFVYGDLAIEALARSVGRIGRRATRSAAQGQLGSSSGAGGPNSGSGSAVLSALVSVYYQAQRKLQTRQAACSPEAVVKLQAALGSIGTQTKGKDRDAGDSLATAGNSPQSQDLSPVAGQPGSPGTEGATSPDAESPAQKAKPSAQAAISGRLRAIESALRDINLDESQQ